MYGSVHVTEKLLFVTLLQLIVMIAAARTGNILLRRLGQPGVVGEIIAGLILGPSIFGHLFPGISRFLFGGAALAPLMTISQIGLVFLMFQIGSEFEFARLARGSTRNAAVGIAAASVAVPFALGFAIGRISVQDLAPHADPLIYSLFFGVGMAITAVPILGRILREFDMTRTELGVVAISAAALNDVAGWLLLASISAFATAHFSLLGAGLQMVGVVLLLIGAQYAMRPIVGALLRAMPVVAGRLQPNMLAAVICLIFAAGICTNQLGIFAIFGGFLAGLLFHQEHAFVEAWREQVGTFVLVFFLPVFFTYTGLRTNLLGLTTASDWQWLGLILTAAVLGKFIPVYLSSRVAGFGHADAGILGVLLNTRALMELIVLNIGYDLGFIPQRVFTMLVIMAVVTTVMTGPLLRALLPQAGFIRPAPIDA